MWPGAISCFFGSTSAQTAIANGQRGWKPQPDGRVAAAPHGQHRLREDEAKKLAATVGVDVETAMVTTAMPLRTEFPLTTDPFKYRLMELVGVHGDALRERCQELFGDGILSAIDCVVKLETKGGRVVLTIDAKFLHSKEF